MWPPGSAVHFLAEKALPFRIEWRPSNLFVASREHPRDDLK